MKSTVVPVPSPLKMRPLISLYIVGQKPGRLAYPVSMIHKFNVPEFLSVIPPDKEKFIVSPAVLEFVITVLILLVSRV